MTINTGLTLAIPIAVVPRCDSVDKDGSWTPNLASKQSVEGLNQIRRCVVDDLVVLGFSESPQYF
jgi:hypothetical protein